MTLGDLLKRIDLDKDCDKMFILRDSNGGWTNVHFIIQDNEISIVADVTRPFSSDSGYQVPDIPPYKIGDEDYWDRIICERYSSCLKDNDVDWSYITDWKKSVRYI